MSNNKNDLLQHVETHCKSLLNELQIIWNEVGEIDTDREKMLLELELQCLGVYQRKVDQANRSRAQLRQIIAEHEAELASICSIMGERPVHIRQVDQNAGTLKEELHKILPRFKEMLEKKLERRKMFTEVCYEIEKVSNEIHGYAYEMPFDDADLSLRKLEELHRQLHSLQKEKSELLRKVQEHLYDLNMLCLVLGMDFKKILSEVHPSLGEFEKGPTDITISTVQSLASTIQKLREDKIKRMEKLQDLATTMLELWNLMDTPSEEQQKYQSITCNVAASEHEITSPDALSLDYINYVEKEVAKLETLKLSKMKELVFKKRSELHEIYTKTHMVTKPDIAIDNAIEAINTGNMDPFFILHQLELHIANAKEEAFSKKEILEKVEKWLGAQEEECWLEEYNRDENRYNAGKGAHLILKRAEKARSLVNKLPGMVEGLTSKTMTWENEKGMEFLYDGTRLLSMLEEYTKYRQGKVDERRRQRDQKKSIVDQKIASGSKIPLKLQSPKKAFPKFSYNGASNKKFIVGGAVNQTLTIRNNKKIDQLNQNNHSSLLNDDGLDSMSDDDNFESEE